MVNGQTIAQAEQQISDIESQVLSREQLIGTQESQIRRAFVPGTIESQFAFGSGAALRQARLGLVGQQQAGLSLLGSQRGELGVIRGQVAERKAEIATVKAAQVAFAKAERERSFERKQALKRFEERRQKAIDRGEIPSSTPPAPTIAKAPQPSFTITSPIPFPQTFPEAITGGQSTFIEDPTLRPRIVPSIRITKTQPPFIDQGVVVPEGAVGSAIDGGFLFEAPGGGVTVVRPPGLGTFQSFPLTPLQGATVQTQLPAFQSTPLQSFASPTDLTIAPSLTTPSSFFTPQGSFELPSRTGGLLTVSEREAKDLGVRGAIIEGPTTPESFVTAVERGAIIGQFRAPTQDPFSSFVFGPSQEFIETERATALEAQRTAQFIVGSGTPFLSETQFTQQLGDIRTGAIQQARGEFALFPDTRQGQARVASFAQIPTRFGVGTAEFGAQVLGAFGQQTPGQVRKVEFAEDTLFGQTLASPFLRPSDDFFGKLGPQAIGTGAIVIPALTFGGRQFIRQGRELGFAEAGFEAVSIASPLRLQSGVLTPITTPSTRLEGFGFVQKGPSGVTRRELVFQGVDTPIEVLVSQESLGFGPSSVITAQQTVTTAPAFRIGGGGGFVSEGVRITETGTFGTGFGGRRGRVVRDIFGGPDTGLSIGPRSPGFDFSIADTATIPRADLFVFEGAGSFGTVGGRTATLLRGGGVSRQITDTPFTQFAAGPRRGVFGPLDVDPLTGTRTLRTTRARIRPTVTGFEIDLGTVGAGQEITGLGAVRTSGRRSTLQAQQLVDPNLGAALQAARGALRTPPIPRTRGPSLDVIGLEARRIADLPSAVGGRGLGLRTDLASFRGPSVGFDFQGTAGPLELSLPRSRGPTGITGLGLDLGLIDRAGLASGLGLGLGLGAVQAPATRTRLGLGLIQLPATAQVPLSRQFQPTAQASRTAQRTRTLQLQASLAPTLDVFPGVRRGRGFGTPFGGFPLPGIPTFGDFGEPSKPRKGRKRRAPIRPSFTAEALGLEAFEQLVPSAQFGISPFEIRRRLVKRPKKKKSKKKKK